MPISAAHVLQCVCLCVCMRICLCARGTCCVHMHGRQDSKDERLPLKLKRAFGALIIFFVTLQYDTLPSHQHTLLSPPLRLLCVGLSRDKTHCVSYCLLYLLPLSPAKKKNQLHVRGCRERVSE